MVEIAERRPGSLPLRVGAAIALAFAALAVLAAWVLPRAGDGDAGASSRVAPIAASADDLRALARSVRHPIYWAGARPGHRQELTHTPAGNIYVRYLPPGVELGDRRAAFLTVGTYPHEQALAALRREARKRGMVARRIGGGGLAVTDPRRPKSIHFAYPRSAVQIEVYGPAPRQARDLVRAGRIRPVR